MTVGGPAPGMRPCARCGVPTDVSVMVRVKTRKGHHVWLDQECLRIWRRLKVRIK